MHKTQQASAQSSGATLAEIVQLLPRLTTTELRQLKARVEFLTPAESVAEDWFTHGFIYELNRRGLFADVRVFPKGWLPPGWAQKRMTVSTYLLKGLGNVKVNNTERMLLAAQAWGALIDFLDDAKIYISPKTLLSKVEHIPAALDAAFPGYWRAGRLSFIATKR